MQVRDPALVLTQEVKDHYASGNHRELLFAELHFASGTQYVHTGERTYIWGGNDWLAIGELGSISAIKRTADMGAHSVTLRFAAPATVEGAPGALLVSARDRIDYKGRDVILYVGLLDEHYRLLADPHPIFAGFMDQCVPTMADKTGIVQMTCESELIKLLKPNTPLFSDQEHQSRYPGDTFFKHLANQINKKVTWFGRSVQPGSGGSPSNPSDRFTDRRER